MRVATVCALAISMALAASAASAQNDPAKALAVAAATAAPVATQATCPGNPNPLGVARVVEIDTTGGPGFGFEHFKAYDFLREGEVVLTFDDGPWPGNTPAVLKALAAQCTKALFFPIGKHAMWHPEILKQVAAAGHTIGSHTWSHVDLSKLTSDQAKEEIEKGVSAVRVALGQPEAPFFRFPALRHSPELLAYLGTRNIGIFSTDVDSFDFKIRKPEDVVKSVMTKLAKNGKGILLMHDFQHGTAEAMPEILHQLHLAGYKVVGLVPKFAVTTIPKYDDMVRADDKYSSSNNTRPENSVIKTISE